MINENNLRYRRYCSENISFIENYDKAVNDTTQIWDCHHRKEIELNKNKQELIDMGLYYNRPASELIFLTHSEHTTLHMSGSMNPMYGKNFEDFMTDEAIKERRKKISEGNKNKQFSEEHKQKLSKVHKDKPKPKYKWLTPSGEIKEMSISNVKYWHPDWILIGEV